MKKKVYNDRPRISLIGLRYRLAWCRDVTATDATMREYMSLSTAGVGLRLRTKTSPPGPMIVNVADLSPYLDQLYVRIAEEPSITSQRLSDFLLRAIVGFLILLR